MALYGGLPQGVFLSQVQSVPEGYLLSWQVWAEGLPLEGNNHQAEVLVNEAGLVRYSRNFVIPVQDFPISCPLASPEEVLSRVVELYQEHFLLPGDGHLPKTDLVLEDLYLCYYLQDSLDSVDEQVAVPSWAVCLEGGTVFYLHGRDLELLHIVRSDQLTDQGW